MPLCLREAGGWALTVQARELSLIISPIWAVRLHVVACPICFVFSESVASAVTRVPADVTLSWKEQLWFGAFRLACQISSGRFALRVIISSRHLHDALMGACIQGKTRGQDI